VPIPTTPKKRVFFSCFLFNVLHRSASYKIDQDGTADLRSLAVLGKPQELLHFQKNFRWVNLSFAEAFYMASNRM
jgi:hypothetical protein